MATTSNRWHVLKCDDGYLGRQWTVKQNTIVSPRVAVFPELKPPMYGVLCLAFGPDECRDLAAWGEAIMGVEFTPVRIRFEGVGGKDARIVIA